MQHVGAYLVVSDDECDAVLATSATHPVACDKCLPANLHDSRIVMVECSDCLSTPGKNDCICAPVVSRSRRLGLDNDCFVATQDWQEYEYQQGRYMLKLDYGVPRVEEDIWMEDTATHVWSLVAPAETTVLNLALFLKRKFDRNVWNLIASYWNSSYYHTGAHKYPFLHEVLDYYARDTMACARLFDATHRVAYAMPIRGYCLRCGEPSVNNRCSSGILRYISGPRFLKLLTKKFVLGVMGVCHRCNVTGFQWDTYRRRVIIEDILLQRGALKF
jgi:hypothetical protein